MANEIVSLGKVRENTYRFAFLYLIPSADRVEYTDGSGTVKQVVPTPAPTEGTPADMLTQTEQDALNAGNAAYETTTVSIDPALSGAENLAAVQAVYEDRLAEYLARYAERWDRYGQRFDRS